MSSAVVDKPKSTEAPKPEPKGAERRRRRRAKITAQLRARPAHAAHLFSDVCKTVDVSRDGVLFTTSRKDYSKGQRLEITFPYTSGAEEFNQPQAAEVVRATKHPDGTMSVAIEFLSAREALKADRKGGITLGAAASNRTNSSERPVVLAIEPDLLNAEAIHAALQQDGYDVLTVNTPREAFKAMRTLVPAVVIAELESKEISGHDLCGVIKRDERLHSVPVILMTQAAQPADNTTSQSLGAVICMSKPFKPERLRHVVKLIAPPAMKSSYSSSFGAVSVARHVSKYE
jgi:CheY-like chemotaxis protein